MPALPTLRGQALQQFAQALGDLVEVGHTRVGEGHVDAATTPPALGLGIGVLLAFRQASLALCLSGGRLVRGRLLFLALVVRSLMIGCLRSLKKNRERERERERERALLGTKVQYVPGAPLQLRTENKILKLSIPTVGTGG